MSFDNLVQSAKQEFPKLQVKYKDQSLFMKILGKLLFFNPNFMETTTTTIGNTIYFPNEEFVTANHIAASIIFLHEIVHIFDQKRVSQFLFSISYLFPQILVPFCALLFFVLNWYIALPIMLLFVAPIPAFFRMHWEKRAYISSLYTVKLLGQRLNFIPHLDIMADQSMKHFHDSSYYFMWPFNDVDKQFTDAVQKVESGQRPYDDAVFDTLDKLVIKV